MTCKYETEKGLCEISGTLCKDVIICTPETVYVDANYNNNEKEQSNE